MKFYKNLLTVALGATMTLSVAQANTEKSEDQVIAGISNASLVTSGVVLGALAVLDNNDGTNRANPTEPTGPINPTDPTDPSTPDTTDNTTTTTTTTTSGTTSTTTTTATATTTN